MFNVDAIREALKRKRSPEGEASGIVHLGAGKASEAALYYDLVGKPGQVAWVDAFFGKPQHVDAKDVWDDKRLIGRPDGRFYSIDNTFFQCSDKSLSSIMEPVTANHPGVTFAQSKHDSARPLGRIQENWPRMSYYNVWVVQLNGAEYDILASASKEIGRARVLIVDVYHTQLYQHQATPHDMDKLLYALGFDRKLSCPRGSAISEVMYVRRGED